MAAWLKAYKGVRLALGRLSWDARRDVDTSPLVGGSYALTQRVPLLESRTQDSEILGTLEVQAATGREESALSFD